MDRVAAAPERYSPQEALGRDVGRILRSVDPALTYRADRGFGLPGLHFHDLRHTGNVLAAQTTGATLRDLMARMGPDSRRAALIYQHLTRDADRHIAEAIAAQIARDVTGSSGRDEGADTGAQ
ncbi:hypothetical protein ABN028_08420 [Actinopolymorpha sp. B17G11]|uniref:hypothetical protein n=1 Tax=Actinopolymorpha sp. B17G11 TaxID=3160861 RepID=UPI0032E50ED5